MHNVYVRLLTYILSPLLGLIPAVSTNYITLQVIDGWVRLGVHPEGLIIAFVTALTVTGATFKIWGKS